MIYLECHLDTYLLEFLGYEFNEQFVHSGSKGEVLKDMSDSLISLGIIDQDPAGGNHYPQLNEYDSADIILAHNLKLLEKREKVGHKLIEIPDELEVWLETMARQSNFNLLRSGLLTKTGSLKKVYKDRERPRLNEFFIQLKSNPSFLQFVRWVEEFHN